MRQLKEVAPKLFMSKNDEYFPNTDERVLFIGGTLPQVNIPLLLETGVRNVSYLLIFYLFYLYLLVYI